MLLLVNGEFTLLLSKYAIYLFFETHKQRANYCGEMQKFQSVDYWRVPRTDTVKIIIMVYAGMVN